jgi:hypothetical protein
VSGGTAGEPAGVVVHLSYERPADAVAWLCRVFGLQETVRPETWGLRGDPLPMGRALREHLSGTEIPVSAGEAVSLLHAAFDELAGLDLVSDTASSVHQAQ